MSVTIVSQPGSGGSYYRGASVSLTTVAVSSTSSIKMYQWYRNGRAYKTGSKLTVPTSVVGTSTYYCVATDYEGASATSNTSTIIVRATPTPSITSETISGATYYKGDAATSFSVTASSASGTLSYQWQKSTDGSSWSNVSGATSRTYTPPTTDVSVTQYRCRVTNTKNGYTSTAVSSTATITVLGIPTPVINTQPSGATYYPGDTVSALFCSGASASGTISYQWAVSVNGSAQADISGATSPAYTPTLSVGDTRYYVCKVTNTLNGYTSTVTSSTAKVVMSDTPSPVITSQPSGKTVYIGASSATMSIAATSEKGTLSYEWRESDGGIWLPISGAISSSYTETDNDTVGTRSYRCDVSNNLNGYSKGPMLSNVVTLTVLDTPVPQFTSAYNVQSATYYTGDTAAVMNASATSASGTISYRWQSSPDGSSWSNISGATSATYTPPTASASATYYRCVVTNTLNGYVKRKYSDTACITVISGTVPVPAFTADYDMASADYYIGAPTQTLNASATASRGTLTYQWQQSSDLTEWTNVGGAITAVYTPSSGSIYETYYRCVIVNTVGEETAQLVSTNALITVSDTPAPALTQQSNLDDAAYVQSASPTPLSAQASVPAGTITYQWQESGDGETWTDISGATSAAYSPATDTLGTTQYRAVITNTLYGHTAQTTTDAASVRIGAPSVPVITQQPQDASYDTGDTATPLTVEYTTDTPPVEFQWQKSLDGSTWEDIDGATDETYTPSTLTAETAYYRAILTNGYGEHAVSATSNAAEIVVTLADPVFTQQPQDADYDYRANPQPLTVTVSAPGSTLSYQWQSSPDGVTYTDITGATASSYTPSTATRSALYYRCVATATNNGQTASASSGPAFVRVTGGEAPIFVQPLKSGTYRADEGVAALNGTATSPDAVEIRYQWYFSQDGETFYPINGATKATYTPASGGIQYYYVIATAVFDDESTTSSRSNTAEILILNARYEFGEDWRQYLNALHGSFVKLVRLEFLQPDGSVAFALDNNAQNRQSGAFIQSGSITVNLQNGIRRTATVTLANLDNEYDYNVNKIWFGQQVLLSEGMVLPNGQEFYLPQGVFYIKNPEEKVMPNLRTVTYKLEDNWSYLNGDLFGRLDGIYEIDLGVNIFDAIQSVLDQDRGNGQKVDSVKPVFTEYYNDRYTQLPDGTYVSDLVTPYTYRNDSDSGTYADIILEMVGVLAAWVGYDAAGRLRIDPSQDDILDTTKPVQWEFSPRNADFLGATYTVKNADVYNDVIITGESLSGFGYISGRAQNQDPRSDTNVNIIGRKTYRESSAGFYTREQCENLAVFRLKRQTVLQKSVSISCQQIFHISENQLVTIERPDKPGIPVERHLVTGFTRPLAQTGPMTIQATSVNDFPMATIIWPDNTQGTQTLKVGAAIVGEQYENTATAD